MFFKKKEKENEQKNTVGTFSGLVNLTKSVFKKIITSKQIITYLIIIFFIKSPLLA